MNVHLNLLPMYVIVAIIWVFTLTGIWNSVRIATTGENLITYLVTDGNCWKLEDCQDKPYPFECRLPFGLRSRYCINPSRPAGSHHADE